MNSRKIFRYLAGTSLLWVCYISSFAQQVIGDTTFSQALSRIEESYWNGGYMQFKVSLLYEEYDTVVHPPSSLILNYQLNKNWFYMSGDSTEYMQNDYYRVTVFQRDSLMRVEKPVEITGDLFRINIFQNGFRDNYVNGFSKTDSSSFRKLIINFKNTAPYLKYEIMYDTVSYYIKSIEYRIKKGDYLSPASEQQLALQPEGYISIKQQYSEYATGPFVETYFLTNRYFLNQNGVFVPVSPFINYELINSIIE